VCVCMDNGKTDVFIGSCHESCVGSLS